ncbi:MAG: glycosyltransferase family 2 protein [Leptolyngbyaceae cyanobacterium MO_188.B28]|nr:glycosyltransferase family 2 protein [Leptolyngbyaceae cyanobacterium MO_188.B28]
MNSSIYIIIPVHNRRLCTLACLENLRHQDIINRYKIIVVDDASTDGTSDVVRERYPEVEILVGDGNLWWTGAIVKGMEYAVSKDADYLIWLNDDCLPQKGSIQTLLNACQNNPSAIVGGQSLDPDTLEPSYGGLIRTKSQVLPVHASKGECISCDALSGNFVCIPSRTVKLIDYPDNQRFPHYYSDAVYTYGAKLKGCQIIVIGEAIALCRQDHLYLPSVKYWLENNDSPVLLWEAFLSIKSPHHWSSEFEFYRAFFGIAGLFFYARDRILRFFLITLIVSLIPLKLRVRLIPLFYLIKSVVTH